MKTAVAARGREGAPTTDEEGLSAVREAGRGGEVPRSANPHRWLPSFRARLALESRSGSVQENAERLFRRAEVMGALLLACETDTLEPFVLAREDTPLPDGRSFSSTLLIWVPGEGFAVLTRENGVDHLHEFYHTPSDMIEGQVPYRLLVAATATLLAEDAGPRLLRMQENARRLRSWEREGAERSEPATLSP